MPDELTPVTRLEGFLTGDEQLTPVTRLEKILAGEDVAPVTRLEKFLKLAGGSGGVEMESGSFIAPTPKVSEYSVTFAKTHTDPPDMVVLLLDAAESYDESRYATNDIHAFVYNYWGDYAPTPWASATLKLYGDVFIWYYSTSSTPHVTNTNVILYFPFDPEEVGVTTVLTHPATYVSKDGFTAKNPVSTKYFQSKSKYNWFAFWIA